MSSSDDGSSEEPESSLIVHERQNLQLCAVHTVNNLLQLSEKNQEGWTCGGHDIGKQNAWTYVTKAELDAIADELTVAENQLLLDPSIINESETTASSEQPSLFDKLSSQHRTIVFGNYSTEVCNDPFVRSSNDAFRVDIHDDVLIIMV